jgi:hypothetical protein
MPRARHADCTFADLNGTNVIAASSGGTVNLVHCTFRNNLVTSPPSPSDATTDNPVQPALPGEGSAEGSSYQTCPAVLSVARNPHWTEHYTSMRLERCAFKSNDAQHLLCTTSPENEDDEDPEDKGYHPFFSDEARAVWNIEDTRKYEDDSNSIDDIPIDAGFLAADDPTFLGIQKVMIFSCPRSTSTCWNS